MRMLLMSSQSANSTLVAPSKGEIALSLTIAAKNTMLNALTVDTASLHTAFPGLTGANEVSGGAPAYARKAVTFGAAAGGSRALSAAVTFDVPATTVRWFGFWVSGT